MSDIDARLWSLLSAEDPAVACQGVALLESLDDPALWAALGMHVGVRVYGMRHPELRLARASQLWEVDAVVRDDVMAAAARRMGLLDALESLELFNLQISGLQFLSGLSSLQTLVVTTCPRLTSLSGLSGVVQLTVSHCPELVSIDADLSGLQELTLTHCPGLSEHQLSGLPSSVSVRYSR